MSWLLTGCFGSRSDDRKALLPPAKCIFCDVSVAKGFDVVWEDSAFVAFRDYKPAAAHHIQVIPKKHISSVKVLGKADVELVQTMRDIGQRILDDLKVPPESRVMGFHIPPYNSVNHLHLHVQAMPYKPLRGLKYPIAPGRTPKAKGFSWFVTPEQAIDILGRGKRVGVMPC